MIEILSFIVSSILAILAIVIAILELNISRLATKESKEKEETLKNQKKALNELVPYASQVYKNANLFQMALNEIINKQGNEDYLQIVINSTNSVVIKQQMVFENINILYKKLLKFEDKFPLSSGNDRYIDAFRNYLLTSSNTNESYNELTEYIKDKQQNSDGEINPEVEKHLVTCTNNIVKSCIIDNNNLLQVLPYIQEFYLKYSEDSTTIQ